MISIENTLISEDIFTCSFCCDIPQCKGCCCVEGDAGAPLDEEELEILEENYPIFKKYMDPRGVEVIENGDFFDLDIFGNLVTPLIGQRDCAYSYQDENNITLCAIEKAYLNNEIDYKKPISCDLYPIRIDSYPEYDAINYHQWGICADATQLGKKSKLKVFQFLKNPLIRKYGEDWYNQLCIAHQELFSSK